MSVPGGQTTGNSRSRGGRAPASVNRTKPSPAKEAIRQRAYFKWQAAGKPKGHDLFFWVQAERELYRGA